MIRTVARSLHRARPHALAAVVLLLTACGGYELPTVEPRVTRGVPGFDTRSYPGPAVMRAWRDSSPYRWVGFYLTGAPCYTGTSWSGRRAELEGMGWGLAVLFVGEQDWARGADAHLADPPAQADPRCTRDNLSAARGAADAATAHEAAAREGFPAGTAVFLDVERVDSVSPQLAAYVKGWADGVFERGRYEPALYAHGRNASALYPVLVEAFARHRVARAPRLWVASTGGFGLERAPAESGFPHATVWQGVLDTRETWGGHALLIDQNVAASGSPSR
ncbi:MAG TPA: glycoside hydrolase domain-containing protein [Longimicrobiales bacterium]|nr:glycoside hydrolase domain-containing protein [Longimicrobiales bacterium]